MKTKRVPIRLTEEQYRQLVEAAGSLGMNLASFIRGSALREAIEVNNSTSQKVVLTPSPHHSLPPYIRGEW
ncbi:MAG: type II toxin-antitoxin system TacA family antitoxin [bacterium]